MYKRDQGRVTRIITFILFMVGGFYAGYCWYYFWMQRSAQSAAAVGAAVLFVGMTVWGLMVSFRQPKAGEFLIDLDGEMRKVVWPGIKPLFDPKTEAWGSTYVVIACTIVFTLLIFALDAMLGFGIQRLLFRGLLFAS